MSESKIVSGILLFLCLIGLVYVYFDSQIYIIAKPTLISIDLTIGVSK